MFLSFITLLANRLLGAKALAATMKARTKKTEANILKGYVVSDKSSVVLLSTSMHPYLLLCNRPYFHGNASKTV
jgi:hypothetical protein